MRRRKLQPVEQRCVERFSILLHFSRSSFKTDFSQKKALNAELKNSVYAGFGACAESSMYRIVHRRIIPLTNIASVTERPAVSCLRLDEIIIDVNLKPTAPPVTLHGTRTGAQGSAVYFSYQSHSIPLYYVKNHQAFAEAIKSRITF